MGQQALVALIAAAALIAAFPILNAELDRAEFGYEEPTPIAVKYPDTGANGTEKWPTSSSSNMLTTGTLELDNKNQEGSWTSTTVAAAGDRIAVEAMNYTAVNNPSGTITVVASSDGFMTVKDRAMYVIQNGQNVVDVGGDIEPAANIRIMVEMNAGTGGLTDLGWSGSRLRLTETLRPAYVALVKYVALIVFFFLAALWLAGGRQ